MTFIVIQCIIKTIKQNNKTKTQKIGGSKKMKIKYKNKTYKLKEKRKTFYLFIFLTIILLVVAHLDFLEHLQ